MSGVQPDLGELEGPVLLFGGPYSNLQATLEMQSEATRRGIPPGNVICNGDIVAYCGQPSETVDLVRDWRIHVVLGNCEESLAEGADDCGCGFEKGSLCSALSDAWYRFADTRVNREQRLWMAGLPRSIRFRLGGKSFVVIHGGVSEISEFVFSSSSKLDKRDAIDSADADCIVGGHSGLPFGQALPGNTASDDERYWLNTGVIGMPANDGTPDGWYLLLTPNPAGDGVEAGWQRLHYDSESASDAMAAVGLDTPYRDALLNGLWPSMDVLPAAERAAQGQPIKLPPLHLR